MASLRVLVVNGARLGDGVVRELTGFTQLRLLWLGNTYDSSSRVLRVLRHALEPAGVQVHSAPRFGHRPALF